jgi:hypothetical protein
MQVVEKIGRPWQTTFEVKRARTPPSLRIEVSSADFGVELA